MEDGAVKAEPNEKSSRKRKNVEEWDKTWRKRARNSKEAKVLPQIGCNHTIRSSHWPTHLTKDDIKGKSSV